MSFEDCICSSLNPPGHTPQNWLLTCASCSRTQHRICMGLHDLKVPAVYLCHVCTAADDDNVIDLTTENRDEDVRTAHRKTRVALRSGKKIWKVREQKYWQDLPTEETVMDMNREYEGEIEEEKDGGDEKAMEVEVGVEVGQGEDVVESIEGYGDLEFNDRAKGGGREAEDEREDGSARGSSRTLGRHSGDRS